MLGECSASEKMSDNNLYLIGEFNDSNILGFLFSGIESIISESTLRNFTKTTLPTNGHVLRRVMHLRLEDNLTVNESIERVVGELVSLWTNFGIITKKQSKVKFLVNKFYLEYFALTKSKFKPNVVEKERRESNFKSKFPQLFDIAAAGWYS